MGFLYLETGEIFEGKSIGFDGVNVGELVFNTSMVGYQEILTDPSYAGQIITMTYPLIGNYGINKSYSESEGVQARGFVVKKVSDIDSNFMTEGTIQEFLINNKVVAIEGVDTRDITRNIRDKGVVKSIISSKELLSNEVMDLFNNFKDISDIAKDVTVSEKKVIKGENENGPKVGILDLGVKQNIVRNLIKRSREVIIYPMSTSTDEIIRDEVDGIHISNGPGDPAVHTEVIKTIAELVEIMPVFGICFGHQLLSLAMGAKTYKMTFGHRGGNHGVKNIKTNKSFICSQNHGYAVDSESLKDTKLEPYYLNLNDETVEGVIHTEKHAFSVQFHPESAPGPNDTEFIFDDFIKMINGSKAGKTLKEIFDQPAFENKKQKINKVLIIGSGPIIIGQAAEFDYSGTQACKAIKEEGIEIVLLNSNPATIMTDENIADRVYIEPINVETVERIIQKEKPDGILAGFGGQTALNLAMKLEEEGILAKYGIKLLGINSESIKRAEDRELFKELLEKIGEPVAKSAIVSTIIDAVEFSNEINYPIIVRPAYTLGGSGGGIANNETELVEIVERGLTLSPINQVLIERSLLGWKEVEYEVMRDKKGNFITVCNMENFDPVGVHTGDSIVVAPSQTLTNFEYQMLRDSSYRIIDELKIEGGCNVQFALDPISHNYIVIEVNPRVSRSSALASKATGYPIAKIAAKIALGYTLDELTNYVTQKSSAFFEPAIDYIVVKVPKWPFNKFKTASPTLNTQMKATGEVMSISRTFESAFMKAIISLEGDYTGLGLNREISDAELEEMIITSHYERAFAIAESLRRGKTIDEIHKISKIDKWFLTGLQNIIDVENSLINNPDNIAIKNAEKMCFLDEEIEKLLNMSDENMKELRDAEKIYPVYKMVDTCAGEFEAVTPYYYSTFEDKDEVIVTENKKIIIIGSGPIRIGQGIEFDYCSVHGVWAIKELGYEAIIINNNPETVSTDFDTSDKLYFESLHIDDVMNIIKKEKPYGVILQFGGQTSINLAEKLEKYGVKILGTDFESIDLAEDRIKFKEFLNNLDIKSPDGAIATSYSEALEIVKVLDYPVMIRPSYVIGGRAMKIVYTDKELEEYLAEAKKVGDATILIDKYLEGIEIEVDAISDGKDILIPGIMEHIEKTGVHSGDSITAYPPLTLSDEIIEKLVETTKKIAINIKNKGLINIQYALKDGELYIIEVNPRASRTVPILSKITETPMIKIATRIMLEEKLEDMEYGKGLKPNKNFHAIKYPVFSTEKLSDVDIFLGPEMKSTGEILAIDSDLNKAIYKGFLATNISKIEPIGKNGKGEKVYVSMNPYTKKKSLELVKNLIKLGFQIVASKKTYDYLISENVEVELEVIESVIQNLQDYVMVINTPTEGNGLLRNGFKLRRKCAELKRLLFTNIETASLYLKIYEVSEELDYNELKYYLSK